MFTLLSRIFVPDKCRPRSGAVGQALAAYMEIDVDDRSIEPLLATNMRGTFLQTRVSIAGVARFGFSNCAPQDEYQVLAELHRVLVAKAGEGWPSPADSVGAAMERMLRNQLLPTAILVSNEGDFQIPEGVKSVTLPLPPKTGLVFTTQDKTGLYVRIGDSLGILMHNADKVVVPVVLP